MVAEIIIGIILILLSLALIAMILMQTGKDKSLSSTLAGGSDTYFSKSGGSSKDKLLFRLTVAGTIVFAVLAIVMVILL